MIDLVILVFLGLLLARGWTRGFVREAMDLVGLVIGTILAFRLGPAFGSIVAAMAVLNVKRRPISSDTLRMVS